MDCSLPGSSIHGIFQARVVEWGAIAFSCTQVIGSPKCTKIFPKEDMKSREALGSLPCRRYRGPKVWGWESKEVCGRDR